MSIYVQQQKKSVYGFFWEEVLGLDPTRVMGNEVNLEIKVEPDHMHFVMQGDFKEPQNKEEGKCLYCNNTVGKQPVFAFGNSMGDHALLQYTEMNPKLSMVMILDHDDPNREIEYHDEELLSASKSRGWNIISMRQDFKRVFADEK